MGNLVALGKIRIEIVFAGEARMLVDGAVKGESGAHGELDGALVEDGKRAGKAKADGANVGVRRIAETRGAGTKDFGVGEKLDVDFEADNRFVFGAHLGREHGSFFGGFGGHDETGIIALRREPTTVGKRSPRSGGGVFAKREEGTLREGEAAEKESGVEDVAGKHVEEERNGGHVASD